MYLFTLVSNYLGVLMMMFGIFLIFSSGLMVLSMTSVFLEWEMFSNYSFGFTATFLFDWISTSFSGFVLLISGLVMIYSSEYMSSETNFYRFIILVSLFVVSMIFMIISPNMISILLGWDGLGLVSYCLVIYYQNVKSANAGMLTILSNRVGDVAILLAIAWLFNFGSWNFTYLQSMYYNEAGTVLFLVMLAALTKSAQIPFSAWLPAAMAAPTPVSALVHSSTLVTAGVYLLIRFSEVLGVSYILFFLAVLTTFMSGLGANFEMDLKKIIALSTLSQLGVMMSSLSLGLTELAYFHLLTHALFKSLLFLCAGVCIHGSLDIQDIRYMGMMSCSAPLTSMYFLGCSLALCGFSFMSGFYSKDLILETYFSGWMNSFMYMFLLLGTFFTVTYSVRLAIYLLVKPSGKLLIGHFMENKIMLVPMSLLFSLAVSSGSLLSWMFLPIFYITLPMAQKLMILLFIVLYTGVFLIKQFMMSEFLLSHYQKMNMVNIINFLGSMWWLPLGSVNWSWLLMIGAKMIKMLDQGWTEVIGPQGVYLKLSSYSMFGDMFTFLTAKKFMLMFIVMAWFILLMI